MGYKNLCYSGIGWDADGLLFDIGGVMKLKNKIQQEEIELEEYRKFLDKWIKRQQNELKIELFIKKHAIKIVIAGGVIFIFILFTLFTLETSGFFR